MKLYHNPRCSKSRKAAELVPEETEIIEYLKHPPCVDELRELCTLLQMNPKELLRKNENKYQELIKQNGKPNEETALLWMSEYPKLMQRPIFVKDKKAIVARPPKKALEVL